MPAPSTAKLYEQLQQELAISDTAQRREWAKSIVTNRIQLSELMPLMLRDDKTAMRFTWLLSDVAEVDPKTLYHFLVEFFNYPGRNTFFDSTTAFARYWYICGVPPEHDGQAVELCFQWLNQPGAKVSLKLPAMKVLVRLTQKYPELKNELVTSMEEQLEGNTPAFRVQVQKALASLDKAKH